MTQTADRYGKVLYDQLDRSDNDIFCFIQQKMWNR